jgi:spore coat polysaccharide biosynthesis predicted glycosyltransferase SpsG/RimJ/RimL family protein N-acetyltransferase
MRLLLRCDASPAGGAGHLMRCVSIAEAARAIGHEVVLAGEIAAVPWAGGLLDALQVDVVAAPPWHELRAWLTGQAFAAVHVDAYDAPSDLRRQCAAAGVVLSSIEDGTWGRRPADVVVDPSLGAETGPRPDDGSAAVLRGARYAPVRAAVRAGRLAAAARTQGDPLEVVVVLGGTDATGALAATLAAVGRAQQAEHVPPLRVRAVAPTGALPDVGMLVEPILPGPGLVDAMAGADLVVTAAGSTVSECWCLGVPAAAVPVADNQLPGYAQALRRQLVFGLGRDDRPGLDEQAADTLALAARSAGRRRDVATRAAAEPVRHRRPPGLRAVERAVGPAAWLPPPALRVRPVSPADAAALLEWRNDPQTRASSRMQDLISWAEHSAWLARVIASPERHLLVVEDHAVQPVGSVRWDACGADRSAWEVSIGLAPHARSRGWGAEVLRLGTMELAEIETAARVLVAHVHESNGASARLFDEAGYRIVGGPSAEGFLRWERRLP